MWNTILAGALLLLLLVAVGCLLFFGNRSDLTAAACNTKGGIYLRTYAGYTCVKLEVLP